MQSNWPFQRRAASWIDNPAGFLGIRHAKLPRSHVRTGSLLIIPLTVQASVFTVRQQECSSMGKTRKNEAAIESLVEG